MVAIVSASSARLVVAVAHHAREAQRDAAGVARARLDAVERDLDDELGPDVDRRSRRGAISSSSRRSVCHASISSVRPLNVLPSITKPPVAGSRAPRCRFESQPLAAAVAPLGREHDEVERVHGLDLEPARAAPAGLVGRVERLHHHALVARARARRRGTPAPPPTSSRHEPRHASAAGSDGSSAAQPLARRAGRAGPRRRGAGTSKKNGDSGDGLAQRARRRRGSPTRLTVSWNGCGRPSGRSAIASPSRTIDRERQRAHGLDDLRQRGR